MPGCENKQQGPGESMSENVDEESEQARQTVTVIDSIGRR